MTAAGLIGSLPGASQARPVAAVADCLGASVPATPAATASFALPTNGATPLLAQALPGSTPARSSAPTSARQTPNSSPQLAQAAVPESLPACTYDPPLPTSPVIRGLW